MNDRSTFRLSAHRLAWCAVNGLLWMPGLAFAVMGFLQWFGPRGATTTNPNLAFLLSGLAVFALLFARNLAVALRSSEPPSALVVDKVCFDPALSSREKLRRLARNWLFYLTLFMLALWLVAVLVKTGG